VEDGEEDTTRSVGRYQAYFHDPHCHPQMHFHGSKHLVDTLFRFRVGAAGLRACLHAASPHDRSCPFCVHDALEDEKHVVQNCPVYEEIRSKPAFSHLVKTLMEQGVHALFNVQDQHSLACFLSQLLWKRTHLLRAQSRYALAT